MKNTPAKACNAPLHALLPPGPCRVPPQVEAVEAMVEDAGQHNVSLDGLAICLGPDLRAMYPLVMNFGVAGELAVSGPAHPDQVRRHRWLGRAQVVGAAGRGLKFKERGIVCLRALEQSFAL